MSEYQSKVTSFEVDGMQNTDISARFNNFFFASFCATCASLTLMLMAKIYDMMRKTSSHNPRGGCSAVVLGGSYLTLSCLCAVIYIVGMVWRFNSYGVMCTEDALPKQGSAIKYYYVATLLIPCCPCAVLLAVCF